MGAKAKRQKAQANHLAEIQKQRLEYELRCTQTQSFAHVAIKRSLLHTLHSNAVFCTRCTQTQSFAYVALKRSLLPAAFAMLLPRSLAALTFPCDRERRHKDNMEKKQQEAERKQQGAVAAMASGESEMASAAAESQGKKCVPYKCNAD